MRDLLLAAACILVELALIRPRPRQPGTEHVRWALGRYHQPYFRAFLDRCMASAYQARPGWPLASAGPPEQPGSRHA